MITFLYKISQWPLIFSKKNSRTFQGLLLTCEDMKRGISRYSALGDTNGGGVVRQLVGSGVKPQKMSSFPAP